MPAGSIDVLSRWLVVRHEIEFHHDDPELSDVAGTPDNLLGDDELGIEVTQLSTSLSRIRQSPSKLYGTSPVMTFGSVTS